MKHRPGMVYIGPSPQRLGYRVRRKLRVGDLWITGDCWWIVTRQSPVLGWPRWEPLG